MLEDPILTDEQVAESVQKGNKEHFALLVERYQEKLFRYGTRFLSSQDNITDVVQEVFIKAYESIRSFDLTQRFSPWIYAIAHNTFVNALRKKSRSPIYLFDFDTMIPHPVYEDPKLKEDDEKSMKEMLDKGLEKLNPSYREIIILYYLEEQSYKEIADILRIPIGTVGIRLKRAKEALKKVYDKLGLDYEQ